jgi:tetratricopeptide (TPR) repeat protein
METLYKAGWEAYTDQQKQRAVEIFSRALELAESIGDTRAVVKYSSMLGTALTDLGKMRQALAVFTPILRDCKPSGDADDIYVTLLKYLEIAQRLPISLETIEKAYVQTENYLRDAGHMDWQHSLLLLRAQLYQFRGMHREALEVAQESWALWWAKHPISFTADSHFDDLVEISLYLRNTRQAREYLAEWETLENTMPKAREPMFCSYQSSLARLEGRLQDAVDWARRAALGAEQGDVPGNRRSTAYVLVRAFLCAGDGERARDGLRRLLTLIRHSESGHSRYNINMLRGDYHLALARQAAGVAPTDDEYYMVELLPSDRPTNAKAVRHELVRAQRAYDAAMRVGRWLDEQLQCTLREQEISGRLARVQSVGQRVAFC